MIHIIHNFGEENSTILSTPRALEELIKVDLVSTQEDGDIVLKAGTTKRGREPMNPHRNHDTKKQTICFLTWRQGIAFEIL